MLLSLCSQSQNEHVPCTKKSQGCHNLCQLLRLWHLCQHRQLCPLSSVPTVPSALFVPILPFLHLHLLQKCFQQCQLCHWCQRRQMFYLSTLGQISAVLCSLVLAGRFYFTIFRDVFRLNPGKKKSPLQQFYIYPSFCHLNFTWRHEVGQYRLDRENQLDVNCGRACPTMQNSIKANIQILQKLWDTTVNWQVIKKRINFVLINEWRMLKKQYVERINLWHNVLLSCLFIGLFIDKASHAV